MRTYSSLVLLVLLLFLISPEFCICSCRNSSTSGCIIQEQQALQRLRASFTDAHSLLSSWEGNDYCRWKGVGCDAITGHVVKLDLRFPCPCSYNEFCICLFHLEADEVDPSLLELRHLNYLDLSGNDFHGSMIPTFLGSMKQLRYLNLSYSGFNGKVPHHLGNLSNLQILDIGASFAYPNLLYVDDMGWVSKLSSLKKLGMNGVSLQQAYNLFQVLDKLPFLLQVEFGGCQLTNKHIPGGRVNSTFLSKVQSLNLEGNHLSGPIPDSFRNMTSIRDLNLCYNSLTSVPYWFVNLHSLLHLKLCNNSFLIKDSNESSVISVLTTMCTLQSLDMTHSMNFLRGSKLGLSQGNYSRCRTYDLQVLMLEENGIEDSLAWFGQLTNLKILNLGKNSFYGPIPSSFGNLLSIRTLDLSVNLLTGTIPTSFDALSTLTELHLSDNQLHGSIPSTLGRLSSLKVLDLSNNHLNGSIPESLGRLVNLSVLKVANNSLTGIISDIHLGNLSNLWELQLGFNNLDVKIESNWTPPFKYLENLGMASCNVGPQFPLWLQTQGLPMWAIDLSNNSIEGTIPRWIPGMILGKLDLSNNKIGGLIPPKFNAGQVDLSHNKINGSIPKDFGEKNPDMSDLILRNNLFRGSIPDSLCKMTFLFVLDLSENRLSGEIPNCWGRSQTFQILNLASNHLSGTIPSSFGNVALAWLNLSNNSLHGEPFQALKNIGGLQILDLGENQFSGKIPHWAGERFGFLQILRLHQNLFSGDIPTSLCNLWFLQVLDLGDNDLSSSIPPCIGHLKGMVKDATTITTYMSGVAAGPVNEIAAGPVVSTDEQWERQSLKQVLKGLELDYTKNLKYLVNMDLSNNSLIGLIPEGLTSLSGLIGLNLSHNHFSGKIPSNIQKMESLESIDFSNNHLSGPIPSKMSTMNSLAHLNLSYNNFSGPIPRDNHFLTFDDPSIYVGNPYLCGEPLKNKCFGRYEITPQPPSQNDDKKEKVLFYFVIALGFITGFWSVIGTLLLKRNWRHAYFRYVEKVADRMYVAIMVRAARLRRKIRRE